MLAQGGSLALIAILVRSAPADDAASFIAAYALAALAQPLFANACQPLLIRLVQGGDPAAARGLWRMLLTIAVIGTGAVMLACLAAGLPVLALMLIHVAAAPLALAAAPLIARDGWRQVLSVTIPASGLGIALRLGTLLTGGDLGLVAALFAVEPVVGGLILARRAGFLHGRPARMPTRAMITEAAPLATAMMLSSLFWRSPVLIAALFLVPEGVLQIAIAMQIVTGMLLIPNALCQSLVGLIAQGGAAQDQALLAGGAVVALCGAGAIAAAALIGPIILPLIYGAAGRGAEGLLVIMSPLVALGTIWRLTEISAALSGWLRALVLTRLAALIGQAALLALISFWPRAEGIAALTTFSLLFAAVIAPACLPDQRRDARLLFSGARGLFQRGGLRASKAVFLHG